MSAKAWVRTMQGVYEQYTPPDIDSYFLPRNDLNMKTITPEKSIDLKSIKGTLESSTERNPSEPPDTKRKTS